MNKLNFSANVTRGTKSITLKLLNKMSAFFSQFVLYVTCAKQVREKSIIVYAVALCPADAKRFQRCLKVSILSRISSKNFIPFAVCNNIDIFFWKIVVKRFRQRRRLRG